MDVARALIVGGGPAGAAAAIALGAAGCRALLVERGRGEADPLCGGFLSWRSLATLERLGVAPDTLNRERIDRVRLIAGRHAVVASLPAAAMAVSRRTLDAALLARARQVAAVTSGAMVREIDDGTARLDDGATIRAESLFLASGKHDVRGAARPPDARGRDPALGLRVRLPPAPALDRALAGTIELHLFDRGYAGLARQEDGSVNLCMAVHRSRLTEAGGPAALLDAIGAEMPLLGERLGFMVDTPRIDAIANVPYGWRARRGTAGLFRLGDQAAVIPSLAGEGMGIALASGIAAAAAWQRAGPEGAAAWQAGFARSVARPMAVAGLLRRLGEGPAGPWIAGAMPHRLIQVIAAATRIPHTALPNP